MGRTESIFRPTALDLALQRDPKTQAAEEALRAAASKVAPPAPEKDAEEVVKDADQPDSKPSTT